MREACMDANAHAAMARYLYMTSDGSPRDLRLQARALRGMTGRLLGARPFAGR